MHSLQPEHPHFLLIRSRAGRFNFTLLTRHGRLSGAVFINLKDYRSAKDIHDAAKEKVMLIADQFHAVTRTPAN